MGQFGILEAAVMFLGAIAVLIFQSYRQDRPAGQRLHPAGARARNHRQASPTRQSRSDRARSTVVTSHGPVVGHLRDIECHDFVELADGQRYYFAGAAQMLPDGSADPQCRPDGALILHRTHLYLPRRIHEAAGG